MTADVAGSGVSQPAPWEAQCPVCVESWLDKADGETVCAQCSLSIRVWTFAPPPPRPMLPEGTGRCSVHPENDAAIDCERCGAFACSVCAIELDGQKFCPACVDLLHGRGELESTRTTRWRLDYLALLLCVASFCITVTWPVALGLAIYGLHRRKRDPWLSRWRLITALVLGVLGTVGTVVALMLPFFSGADL